MFRSPAPLFGERPQVQMRRPPMKDLMETQSRSLRILVQSSEGLEPVYSWALDASMIS